MNVKREQSEFWEENDVNTIDEGNSVPKSLVIQCPASSRVSVKPRKITIEVPKKFPYHNNKEVPWNYSCQVKVSHETQSCMDNVKDVSLGNITGVSGMTHSGRCYTPEYLEKLRQEKGKEKVIEEEDDLNEAPPRDAMPRNEGAKRSVTEEEATEFLKIIRQSEYSVVEQLKKLPARISLLSLLLSSEAHREALLKVLNEAHVAHNISLENFDHIVGNIMATDCLTFTDEEIPPEGRGHNKALHISAKCKDYIVARILVDNGSAINVMPKSTLEMLPVDFSNMQHSHMVVRAFDGTRREVLGDIEIPLQIGPCTFQIQFQIMDIKPSYSCLLGRPWIHLAGAVPSTLHQKVKFVVNNQLICVSAEEDFLVTKPITTRYVEAAEEALDCSLQSFEMANAIYVKGGRNNSVADFSNSSKMMARVMLENGYQALQGLGKLCQGIKCPIQLPSHKGKWGLGYNPTKAEKREWLETKKMKRIAAREGKEVADCKRTFPPLNQIFRSGGHNFGERFQKEDELGKCGQIFNHLSINMTDDEEMVLKGPLVLPCQEELGNWIAFKLPINVSK